MVFLSSDLLDLQKFWYFRKILDPTTAMTFGSGIFFFFLSGGNVIFGGVQQTREEKYQIF